VRCNLIPSPQWWQPIPARKSRVEKPAALRAFEKYIDAVNRGKFTEAAGHRHKLQSLGLVVLLQRPGPQGGEA